MTVKELIDKLDKYPENTEIEFHDVTDPEMSIELFFHSIDQDDRDSAVYVTFHD